MSKLAAVTPSDCHQLQLSIAFLALAAATFSDGDPAGKGFSNASSAVVDALRAVPSVEELEARLLPVTVHASADMGNSRHALRYDPESGVIVGADVVVDALSDEGIYLTDEDVTLEYELPGSEQRLPVDLTSFGEHDVMRVQM